MIWFCRNVRLRRMSLILFFLLLRPLTATAYERIVSFRPNVTEILFTLGLGPKVVGVTNFCTYPPEAQKIEKIGGYFNRSLEKVLSLKPDLAVLVPDATTPKIESALKRAGIDVLVVRADSLSDIYNSIQSIASKAGIPKKGEQVVDDLQKQMKDLSQQAEKYSRKKTLLVLQRRPLIVAGSHTFLDALLRLAGGENIAGTSKLPYPHFSMESVLSQKPEVILDLDPTEAGDYWSRYSSLSAVSSQSIYFLSPDLFVPSPRIVKTLALLIEVIHKQGTPSHK